MRYEAWREKRGRHSSEINKLKYISGTEAMAMYRDLRDWIEILREHEARHAGQ